MASSRPLAVVTGASTGIGLELARIAVERGYDLVVAADEPRIDAAADLLRRPGVSVVPVEVDLSTTEGVDRLCEEIARQGRPVEILCANAGRGLGDGFLDQDFAAARRVLDTNVTGTIYLIHRIGREMRARGAGRILITGSIAGFMPGSFQAVYNGTKAFVDSFSWALRNELKDTGVVVTCLMPGPTDTEFFARADLLDTAIGQGGKDDAAMVAAAGFDAMMAGDGDIVTGWKNRVEAALANVMPASMLAERHRRMAEPDSGHH